MAQLNLITPQGPHLQIASRWGWASTYECGGQGHIPCIAAAMLVFEDVFYTQRDGLFTGN